MRRVMLERSLVFVVALAASLGTSPVRAEDYHEGKRSLHERVGASHGRTLLASGTYEDRLRGIERLARTAHREALDALVDTLDGGGPIVTDPRTRLAASRALAPHALSETGRRGLVTILGHALDEDADPLLGALSRDTAAWALARAAAGLTRRPPEERTARDGETGASREERALVPLLAAIIGDTGAAEVAARAVVAHPPRDLGAFVRGVATMTAVEARLLGELRDPRAIGMLRRALVAGDDALKDAAMLALAKLGEHTASARAKELVAHSDAPAERRGLAAEALCVLGHEACANAILALLAAPGSVVLGLDLAERFAHPSLVSGLVGTARVATAPEIAGRALTLLGKSGADGGLDALEAALREPTRALFARAALADCEAPKADELVTRWLERSTGGERLEALRVATARVFGRDGVADVRLVARVTSEVERAIASPEPPLASFGWFAATLLGQREVGLGLAHAAPYVRAAVLSAIASLELTEAAPLLEPLARRALHPRARGAADSIDETALALALLTLPDLGSFDELAQLAEAGTLASPQAAFRLATRDPRASRERVDALLFGTDPTVRAHVALGLGDSRESSAAGRLVAAYRVETEPSVRRSIVRALSNRKEIVRDAALERAATIDPDDEVRALATLALGGKRLATSTPRSRRARWLWLLPSVPEDRGVVALRSVRIESNGELARSALTGPDGVLLAFAPTKGEVTLRPLPSR
ncbi:MAG: HEAT repeat domain-containing protein [Deltaproteobacteria bacterium]|nr:HEAT repeat domain-containing protein [Deltaproteobacteria bacterium]